MQTPLGTLPAVGFATEMIGLAKPSIYMCHVEALLKSSELFIGRVSCDVFGYSSPRLFFWFHHTHRSDRLMTISVNGIVTAR